LIPLLVWGSTFCFRTIGGFQSIGAGGFSLVSMGKELMLRGGRRIYMDVLGQTGQFQGGPLAPVVKAELVPRSFVP
jgi:hypothetical protein